MAKTKISEFSTTAGNNTDINSINIAEGCAPSGINDAIRELMRQLKEFQTGGAGDSVNSGGDFSVATNKFTVASASGNTSVAGTLGVTGAATLSSTLAVTGTTTLTGALVANGNATLGDASGDTVTIKGTPTLEVNPTLSGGTANGVLYLNGSKVATSGSALTFDGTNLGVGATPTSYNSSADNLVLYSTLNTGLTVASGTSNDGSIFFARGTSGADAYRGYIQYYHASDNFAFGVNGSEAMRLTSTGLGVGTSSPFGKLQVKTGTNQNLIVSTQGGELSLESANDAYSAGAAIRYYATAHTWFSGANTMRLDSSGNLGLGVTPSAWNTAYKTLDINSSGLALAGGSQSYAITCNAYYNSSNQWVYKGTTSYGVTIFSSFNGAFTWGTAASGTAGDAITFTQAMTLDASGRLLVGLTSGTSGYNIEAQAGASGTGIRASNSGGGYIAIEAESNATSNGVLRWTNDLKFIEGSTQRMQLSSGNLLVGATATTSYFDGKLNVFNAGVSASFKNDVAALPSIIAWNAATSGTRYFVTFATGTGPTSVGSISTDGSSTTYATSSDYRLKNTIAPMTGALAKVAALKPVTYKWNADGSDGEGFIAHELAEVVPQCVTGEKDAVDAEGNPQYQGIDTSFLVATLTAAIKEQQALIEQLTARVAALES